MPKQKKHSSGSLIPTSIPNSSRSLSVRLAGVYLDEGKYDQGLTVLNAVKDAKGEEVPVYDRMGDLYLAKGDVAAARKSWEDALRHAPMTNPLVGVIEIKLNSLPKE